MALTKKLTQKNMKGEGTTMVLAAGGALSAGFAAQQVEKALKIDATTTGVKKFIPSAILLGVAVYLGVKSKDARVKAAALGVGAAAVTSLAKKAAPRIFGGMAGIEGANDLGLVPMSSNYYNGNRGSYGDMGMIPPATSNGYFIDAPAYVGSAEDGQAQIYGAPDAEYVGAIEDSMQGIDDAQVYGDFDMINGIDGAGGRRRGVQQELYL